MQRMEGVDANFLYLETPTMHMHTVKVAILERRGGFDFDAFVGEVVARLDKLPSFRKRVLMDALHLDQVDWCGLSLGGMIGQWLMINHGDRIAKALLANTVANMPNATIWEDRIGQARREGLSDLAETTLGRWFTPEFAQAHPATIAKVRAMILSTSVEGYCRACEAIRDLDLYDQLDTISNEVMLVCGRHDSSAPTATMTSMAARIKNASIQILDAAHVSNIEQPTAFNAIVSKLFC